ncbi:hypothetical protein QBC40DRAFT_319443 [Triangularia verruculosa]|uniref:Uncharacterized protein n=1 Tax=Triangularia verruculosa TaxID=2587418 RepID=A0AAN6X5K7_9PEZI|nr:hypothetical protein QBC40DRAFT_319443 [Triangularia verruculosa]
MAEIVGLVASVITLADLAGRIATSAVALKRLWDEVKEVPESIVAKTRDTIGNVGAPAFSLQYCRRAVADLESLVDDLRQQISSTQTLKRRIGKVRVSLKKGLMSSYQQRLQSVLSLLSLSQQSYLIALTRFQSSMIVSEFGTFREMQRREKEPDAPETRQQDSASSDQPNVCAQANTWLNLQELPWKSTNYLWSFAFQTKDALHEDLSNEHATPRVYQARLQLPWWLALLGSTADLLAELSQKRASIYDRDPGGWTLLHYAALTGQLGIFQSLMKMGLRVDEIDETGASPLYNMCSFTDHPQTVLDIYRFLLQEGALDNAVDTLFLPGYRNTKKSSLHRYLWKTPYLFNLIANEAVLGSYQLSTSWFQGVNWAYVDPHVLLGILREKFVSPAAFRAQVPKSLQSSLHSFAYWYFVKAVAALNSSSVDTGPRKDFDDWRSLARWIFSEAHDQDLSRTGDKA